MPPLNSKVTRQIVKERNKIEGPKSLHRGIHYHLNEDFAKSYKTNDSNKRHDHRDLLVHHQKINADLQDVYTRVAALHAPEATMEERIEERWRQFEAIGGRRPTNVRTNDRNAVLCTSKTAIPYADRLAQVSAAKKDLRARSEWERETRGEAVDYSANRSAVSEMKNKRVKDFQRRQLKRAHFLRRMGDPEPLKQSGKYDKNSGTFTVFNKTLREVQREVQQDERTRSVRERRGKNSRSQFDIMEQQNINRPDRSVLSYSREWELGPLRKGGKGRKRSRSS
ncbi:hypothetical protein AGDE_11301 [Angomonas deanei]|uniref:Uncharacterized protein n=1 Tax=Angomonas deanei TaxID=59799 RepID=A0A7G2CLY3_9TRYP|nr:hypothetical protein AGDE_11301 [Angomonas deanei]CAD2220439.1 hypothetical protein, conserved [Angomonas deanei]|eukprot:EPY26461.1 hypothetical protein AGDE_11301 [Angomonas deanei]